MKKIILASKSPRRREILSMAGLEFSVIPSDCDEGINESSPGELVSKLSALKANDIASRIKEDCYIIGSDTIVYFDGVVMGKPKNKEEAFRMLKILNGQTHSVYTGVTVIDRVSGQTETFFEKTDVTFWNVSDPEIIQYVNSGDPMDKAGGYGIQGIGTFLVQKINGDYFTVVGLPISHLLRVLKELEYNEK